jgi:hypothetical protein
MCMKQYKVHYYSSEVASRSPHTRIAAQGTSLIGTSPQLRRWRYRIVGNAGQTAEHTGDGQVHKTHVFGQFRRLMQ